MCSLLFGIVYSISSDDGEKEMFVSAELIRALEAPGSPLRGGGAGGGGGALREGMKVEARYRGKSRYYPGVIKRENRDGTFDVDYGNHKSFILCSHIFILKISVVIIETA